MVRVLQKTATLGAGGIQKFLVGVQSNMNRDEVQFDYFLNTQRHDFFTDDVVKMGSRLFGPKENTGNYIKRFIKRYIMFYKTIRKEKYTIVHIDEALILTAVSSVVAKIAGAKVIIAHSHNDHASDSISFLEKKIVNPIARIICSNVATDYFSCSDIAAKWLFTRSRNESGKIRIINNGINSGEFEFNPAIAHEMRNILGLEDAFVVGHIGRFSYQKNHKFILEVFEKILKKKPGSRLLLVGEGELKKGMEEYAIKLGVRESVIFYGLSNEIPKLLQAFDAFIFPSVFEGLGIAAIESQAASVQTFCAEETIAKEVGITDYCHYIPLKAGAEEWAEQIINISSSYVKCSTVQKIKSANFDIKTISKQLEIFYIERS